MRYFTYQYLCKKYRRSIMDFEVCGSNRVIAMKGMRYVLDFVKTLRKTVVSLTVCDICPDRDIHRDRT